MAKLPKAPWEELDLNPVHHIGDSIKAYEVPIEKANPSLLKAMGVNPNHHNYLLGFGVPRKGMSATKVYTTAVA